MTAKDGNTSSSSEAQDRNSSDSTTLDANYNEKTADLFHATSPGTAPSIGVSDGIFGGGDEEQKETNGPSVSRTASNAPNAAAAAEAADADMEKGVPGSHPVSRQNTNTGSNADDDAPEAQRTKLQTVLVVFALCLTLFLAALDQTIVTTAIPTISAHFHSSLGYVWVGGAYTLGNGAFVPVWGKISDIFGRKAIILVSVVTFWIGSLLCAVSTSMGFLIGARAIQGVGAGGLIALPNIAISDLFSMRTRGLYFGLIGMVWAFASAIGPILGGVFTSQASWRWCFWINLPISAVGFVILVFVLKLHNPRTPMIEGLKAIDWSGSLFIVGGTVMLLLGLEFGDIVAPWGSATVVCLIVFGLVSIGIFILVEWKFAKYPLIPLHLFNDRNSVAAYSLSFCHAFTFMGGSYWLPFYFQGVLGASTLLSGVYLLAYALSLSFVSGGVGVWIKKTGLYKIPIIGGMAIMTLGMGLFTDLGSDKNWAKIILYQIVAGLGIGNNFQSPLIALQSNIQPRDIGSATSSFAFLRMLGTSVSVVVGGVIFNNEMQKQQPRLQRELGPEIADRLTGENAAGSVQFVGGLPGHDGDIARDAYWRSMRTMFIVFTAFSFCGTLIGFFIRQRKLSKEHKEHKTGLHTLRKRNSKPSKPSSAA